MPFALNCHEWHCYQFLRKIASKLDPWGGSLLFTTKCPEIPGTHFTNLRRMKGRGQSRLCSHAMVLNRGPLDWESNTLTTRPFFHVLVITWNRKNWRPHRSSFLNIIICSKCTIIQKGIYTRQPCSRREIYFKKSQKQGVFFNMSLKAHSKVWDNFWQLKAH